MKVETLECDGVITQKVTSELINESSVLDVKELHIQTALLKLGWRPPVVRIKRDATMKHIYVTKGGGYYVRIFDKSVPDNYHRVGYFGKDFNAAKAARDEYLKSINFPPVPTHDEI